MTSSRPLLRTLPRVGAATALFAAGLAWGVSPSAWTPVVGDPIEISPPVIDELVDSRPLDVCYGSSSLDEYLVSYTRLTRNLLLARRINADNGEMRGNEIVVYDGSAAGDTATVPAIAYSASSHKYLVTFVNDSGPNRQVLARTVDSTGSTQGGIFQVDEDHPDADQDAPDVVSDGNEFLVVWQVSGRGIFGRFIRADGAPRTSPFPIRAGLEGVLLSPSVACLDGVYLVAHVEVLPSGMGAVRSQTVTAGRQVGPVQGLSAPIGDCSRPCVAANSTDGEWLVAWEKKSGSGGWVVVFRRVNGAGVPQGDREAPLRQNPQGVEGAAAVAWSDDENQYVIFWHAGSSNPADPPPDILGARIAGGTDDIVEMDILIAATADHEVLPVLAARQGPGTREMLGAWAVIQDGFPIRVGYRAARFETSPRPPPPTSPPPPPPIQPTQKSDSGGGCGGGASEAGGAVEMGRWALILAPAAAIAVAGGHVAVDRKQPRHSN